MASESETFAIEALFKLKDEASSALKKIQAESKTTETAFGKLKNAASSTNSAFHMLGGGAMAALGLGAVAHVLSDFADATIRAGIEIEKTHEGLTTMFLLAGTRGELGGIKSFGAAAIEARKSYDELRTMALGSSGTGDIQSYADFVRKMAPTVGMDLAKSMAEGVVPIMRSFGKGGADAGDEMAKMLHGRMRGMFSEEMMAALSLTKADAEYYGNHSKELLDLFVQHFGDAGKIAAEGFGDSLESRITKLEQKRKERLAIGAEAALVTEEVQASIKGFFGDTANTVLTGWADITTLYKHGYSQQLHLARIRQDDLQKEMQVQQELNSISSTATGKLNALAGAIGYLGGAANQLGWLKNLMDIKPKISESFPVDDTTKKNLQKEKNDLEYMRRIVGRSSFAPTHFSAASSKAERELGVPRELYALKGVSPIIKQFEDDLVKLHLPADILKQDLEKLSPPVQAWITKFLGDIRTAVGKAVLPEANLKIDKVEIKLDTRHLDPNRVASVLVHELRNVATRPTQSRNARGFGVSD